MRNFSLSKSVPVWAVAAVLAVAAPGTPLVHAASHRANAELLASQLPGGETLATASTKDVKAAVRSAVAKRPADAADIVRIAIMAKTPKRRAVECGTVREIVDSAVRSAPERARAISEMAESIAPDCSQEIAQAVRGSVNGTGRAPGNAGVPGTIPNGSTTANGDGTASGTGTGGGDGAAGDGGFGGGFGPGSPGSPSFGGSSPSGGFALPPTQNAVTPTVNS